MTTNVLVLAVVLTAAPLFASAQDKPAGSLTDVTGVWIMLIEGHQVGLELEQDGSTVQGVMLMMGQRQLLEGTYIDRTLTLKAEEPPEGTAGPHGSRPHDPIVARMLDDGTLEGEISLRNGRTKWTGERLKQRERRKLVVGSGAGATTTGGVL